MLKPEGVIPNLVRDQHDSLRSLSIIHYKLLIINYPLSIIKIILNFVAFKFLIQ